MKEKETNKVKEGRKQKEAKTEEEIKEEKGKFDLDVKGKLDGEGKFGLDTEEMMEQGLHLGHRISKLHPNMADYVVGIRNTVHIINLNKTKACLEKALDFISEVFTKAGTMLLVGTKPPIRALIKEIGEECGIPYVAERWLGGSLTNFKVISGRIQYYNELKQAKEKGEFEKYLKKERIKKEKHLRKLEGKFEGIKNLQGLPQALFVCDITKNDIPVREAAMKGIKVAAIVDSNVDPLLVDYPIPANDDAISSVKYILDKVKEVIKKSKVQSPA